MALPHSSRSASTGCAALLCLAALLAGCATSPGWPTPDADTQSLPEHVVLEDVPFYPQEKYQCGPASLAMMLNSQGLHTHPDILKELVYIPGREGSLQVEMVAAGRAHGMLVYPLDGTLASLLREVSAGHPVLVMQNLGFDWWPQWHFAVVIGYDAQARDLILHTDTREQEAISQKVFHNTWARADNWAVVMLPPDTVPATAQPLAFLKAAYDLETTGRTTAARQAYITAEHQWPDQPAAVMAQGNLAWQKGQWSQATAHFQRVVTRFPAFADGWNNLAYALEKQSCPSAARRAAQCAAGLAPERFGEPGTFSATGTGSQAACPSLPDCPTSR